MRGEGIETNTNRGEKVPKYLPTGPKDNSTILFMQGTKAKISNEYITMRVLMSDKTTVH